MIGFSQAWSSVVIDFRSAINPNHVPVVLKHVLTYIHLSFYTSLCMFILFLYIMFVNIPVVLWNIAPKFHFEVDLNDKVCLSSCLKLLLLSSLASTQPKKKRKNSGKGCSKTATTNTELCFWKKRKVSLKQQQGEKYARENYGAYSIGWEHNISKRVSVDLHREYELGHIFKMLHV